MFGDDTMNGQTVSNLITLTEEQIAERVTKGSISAEEYEYITGEKYSGGEAK